jgi:hypothetical protein
MGRDRIIYESLLKDLTARYGELIGGSLLSKTLGFSSMAAMKQAINRETLKVPTFFITGRRGRFALTTDVANWLAECRASADKQGPREVPENFKQKGEFT